MKLRDVYQDIDILIIGDYRYRLDHEQVKTDLIQGPVIRLTADADDSLWVELDFTEYMPVVLGPRENHLSGSVRFTNEAEFSKEVEIYAYKEVSLLRDYLGWQTWI